MTLIQVWGALLIFGICPLLGWLPLIDWIALALIGRRLRQIGTGNVSVSAAFYHGGRLVGILAVLSEAAKGITSVLLARSFFPSDPAWEIIALIALIMGRYWFGKGAGTTNVVWGYVAHDWIVAALVFLIGGIGFTILRERKQGRFGVLVLFPLLTALRHPQNHELIGAAIVLAVLMGWIYTKIADDLELSPDDAQTNSRSMFKFFRGDRAVRSLSQVLDPGKVGNKAATLAYLNRLGYPVPMGWILLPGDDPEPLMELLQPSPSLPLVVRSSAIGEDSEVASAAGQYQTILNITRREELLPAITRCLLSYENPAAVRYRHDRGLPEAAMAVLIQEQVRGVFSGVAFSRDPITRQGDAVVIEGLPGAAAQVVSGKVTPESYQVFVRDGDLQRSRSDSPAWLLPDDCVLEVEGSGNLPPRLVQQVAFLTRHLESHYHGVPQDVEWSYDGQILWLLQARPITTLLPIWTRKIAAEVIPGLIHPLTWSINRPLTCGVWGNIFTIVLGDRSRGLDFNETATLHYSRGYFNATLLGQIFRRMGLPPESLEFLTRGSKFSKPPLQSTLRNIPGLLRLVGREITLEQDFQRDERRKFAPALADFSYQPAPSLSDTDLLTRIDRILDLLRTATYYSILAPLSAALRKSLFKVSDDQIDNSATPEVAVLLSLQELAQAARPVLERDSEFSTGRVDSAWASGELASQEVWKIFAKTADGQAILEQFNQLLDRYGYLSEVGTDIAVATWREDPQSVKALLTQFCLQPPVGSGQTPPRSQSKTSVQRRFTLKGRVTEVYSHLLAELRWSVVALEAHWISAGILSQPGDIFFLELSEIRQFVERGHLTEGIGCKDLIAQRRSQLEQDQHLDHVPFLVYGNDPPAPTVLRHPLSSSRQLQGIGASPGQVEGWVKVVRNLAALPEIDSTTILVVPYTDSGWAPLLARAGGLISEVGGRLSHGAIVAREYGIPAVMDIPHATQLFQDGQRVWLDGQQGVVEILE